MVNVQEISLEIYLNNLHRQCFYMHHHTLIVLKCISLPFFLNPQLNIDNYLIDGIY